MKAIEKLVLNNFKALVAKKLKIYKIFLFGSRARGDSVQYSDMDLVVIADGLIAEQDYDFVSDCAWEAGFEKGIVIVPVVFSKDDWENSPERYSLLAQAVKAEGVAV